MKTGNFNMVDSKKILSNKKFLAYVIQGIAWIIAANFFIMFKAWGIEDTAGFLVLKQKNLILIHIEAAIMGLCLGLILAYLDQIRSRFVSRKKIFGMVILIKGLSYLLSIVVIITVVAFIFLLIYGAGINEAFLRIGNFILSTYFLTIVIYGAVVSFLISFIKQIDSKFGPGNLLNMLIGKYHQPRVEDRIFLFIDMKSSTECAEKLGHLKYSRLLQDCFYDITSLIRKYKGEIYQYVGDEIVITWRSHTGLQHHNCIYLFYQFLNRIKDRNDYYISRYGLLPEFKAGMNCGHITVAEVGILKREIAYHGDVINTASRIQAECNRYGQRLLISGQLFNRLDVSNDFRIARTDTTNLKGKNKPVELYSVTESHL